MWWPWSRFTLIAHIFSSQYCFRVRRAMSDGDRLSLQYRQKQRDEFKPLFPMVFEDQSSPRENTAGFTSAATSISWWRWSADTVEDHIGSRERVFVKSCWALSVYCLPPPIRWWSARTFSGPTITRVSNVSAVDSQTDNRISAYPRWFPRLSHISWTESARNDQCHWVWRQDYTESNQHRKNSTIRAIARNRFSAPQEIYHLQRQEIFNRLNRMIPKFSILLGVRQKSISGKLD